MHIFICISHICDGLLSRVWCFATPWTVARQAPVHGILQARILEWVSMSSSRGSSRPRDQRDQTASLTSTALAGGFFTTSVPPGKPLMDGTFFTS